MKTLPPPKVGDVFEGPTIGHGKPVLDRKPGKYYVRAVVDAEEDPKDGWFYYVVFRYYTRNNGWKYLIENAFALAQGAALYRKISKR